MEGISTSNVKSLREELALEAVKKRQLYWMGKRAFDILASLAAIIVLSGFMIVIALIIFIDDPHGSPIFTQERVGRNGKVFKFYKFRSMVVNAEDILDSLQDRNEKTGPVFKIHDDPRITRIGKFIRKTSIDELPQLFNILKGDMSVVGPRPALPKEVEQYDDYARLRLLVTPGLTCYWQVENNRDDISFEEWMRLDVKYIQERSFWVDMKLILMTIKVSVTGQGV
jgi:lipopolysaccharide/colanic/teichoic acid biosynthesis glycosyltransferase